jgi:hypothetical protein
MCGAETVIQTVLERRRSGGYAVIWFRQGDHRMKRLFCPLVSCAATTLLQCSRLGSDTPPICRLGRSTRKSGSRDAYVKAGEMLVPCGVGFGPTTPTVFAWQVVSGAASRVTNPLVTIGGVTATVNFAGIIEAGCFNLTWSSRMRAVAINSCKRPSA